VARHSGSALPCLPPIPGRRKAINPASLSRVRLGGVASAGPAAVLPPPDPRAAPDLGRPLSKIRIRDCLPIRPVAASEPCFSATAEAVDEPPSPAYGQSGRVEIDSETFGRLYVTPSPLGSPSGSAPGRRARVAIVGTGGIAEIAHVPALRSQAHRVDIVAAVDTDPDRLKAFAARHSIPAVRATLEEMLERDRPDLVHLCSPPSTHADHAVRCLEAGAWVWIEKPPARSLAEYDRITAAEREGGPYASVVFQHRFGSAALRLRALARGGAFGRPLVAQCVTAWYRPHEYYDVPWRGRWETEGGGPTMGHGIHQMDLMLSVLGDWAEVRATAARLDRDVETEDVSAALVTFASGAVATVLNSVLSPREESYLRFDFTDASVELRHLYGYSTADWTLTSAPRLAADRDRFAAWADSGADIPSSHRAQLPYLLDAWQRGERPPLSGAEGRETLELVTAIYRSALTGEPVRREQLGADDPFYHRLHGGPGWDPATGGAAIPGPAVSLEAKR
jgi:predicted dehydrogenase